MLSKQLHLLVNKTSIHHAVAVDEVPSCLVSVHFGGSNKTIFSEQSHVGICDSEYCPKCASRSITFQEQIARRKVHDHYILFLIMCIR